MHATRALADPWRASAVALAAFLLSTTAIGAAPPPNDQRSNATVVSALPFTEVVDTTSATTTAEDVSACGNGTGSSIWYTYTATADTQLVVDTLGSNYRTGVYIVYEPVPGGFSCGQGHAVFPMGAGVTVSIMISDNFDLGGGALAVAIYGAVPPANDLIGAATPISALPFEDAVDVTLATADADDAQVNQTCGFFLQRTVWYAFTAGPEDTSLAVDTVDINQSDSSVIIATGPPAALITVACGRQTPGALGPARAAVHTTPGTTYYVLIENGGGGRVPVRVSHAPPEPFFTIRIDGVGTLDHRSGTAGITGTYKCLGDLVFGSAVVTQMKDGHVLRSGSFGFDGFICDGSWRSFSATATPDVQRQVPAGLLSYPFVAGEVLVTPNPIVCSVWGCFPFSVPPTEVQLAP